MKINKLKLRKGFTLVELLVVIAIIAALAALSTPAVTRALGRAALTTSINNARQVKLALDMQAQDFEGEYLSAALIAANSLTGGTGGPAVALGALFENDSYLSGGDESLLYTKELTEFVPAHTRADDDGTTVLVDANCGYSYVEALNNTSNGSWPIITSRTSGGQFFSGLWDHKAVVVYVNGSTKAERINGAPGANGPIFNGSGVDFFTAPTALTSVNLLE